MTGADEALRKVAWDYVEEVWEDLIEDIAYLVEVESVEDLGRVLRAIPELWT